MDTSPTPDPASEGVEHLQRAAKEMISAARKFLDAAEDVVQDQDRFAALSGGVADVISSLAAAIKPTPAPADHSSGRPSRVHSVPVDE